MDTRIIRSLIYLFGGLVVIFSLLILVNYVGSLMADSDRRARQEEEKAEQGGAEARAQRAIAEAKYSAMNNRTSLIPSSRSGLSTSSVVSEGSIRIVKEKGFNGVAEKPKGMMQLLNEMSGGKKKPAPVELGRKALEKKVRPLGSVPGQRLKVSSMPALGRGAADEGVTLFNAPVDYKVFKSSETWWAFANSRKFKPEPHDFSSVDLVILVSVSDFPSGIFRIAGVEAGKKETVVKYRVNPLAMSAEASRSEREHYASSPVPRGKPVRLEQVP